MNRNKKTCFVIWCLIFQAVKSTSSKEVNSLEEEKSRQREEEVASLLSDYFYWKVDTYRFEYYVAGFNVHPGQLDDYSIERFQKIEAKCEHFRDRADELLRQAENELEVRERRFVKVVKREGELCANGSKFKGYYFAPVNVMNGVHTDLANNFKKDSGYLKTDTLKDHKDIIKLLQQVPRQLEQIQILLQKGIESGMTYHEASMSRVPKQFENLLNYGKVENSKFFEPFKALVGDSDEVVEIQEEAMRVIHHEVMPAFQKLKDFIVDEYSKHLRKYPGISSINDDIYQSYLESHTTIKGITPEEIHNTGLDEIARLKTDMMKVIKDELKMENVTFKEAFAVLKSDEQQGFKNEEEIMEYYTKIISDATSKLQPLFDDNVLNSDTYNVSIKPMPPGSGGLAYYNEPSVDGRRKGAFFLNTQNVKANKKFEANSLTLHESNPGHHLQFSFNKHSPIPIFLRSPCYDWPNSAPGVPPSYTSHVEGWGLYAEYLGFEMGMFEDPHQKIGFYSWNLLRAGRLVVDTGIHAFGWSRNRAIQYLLDNTGLSKSNIEGQVDRYITWPGQAVSYKLGEIRIQELRKKRQKELGDKFDIKAFHRHILTCIGPIEMLEECVKEEEKLPFIKRDPNEDKIRLRQPRLGSLDRQMGSAASIKSVPYSISLVLTIAISILVTA